jgi:hypothetical protein
MKARTHLRRLTAMGGRNGGPAAAPCVPAPAAAARAGTAAAGGTAIAGGMAITDGSAVCGGTLPAGALAPLKAIAKNAAQAYGDWRPAQVTAVHTTHARALASAAPRVAAHAPADTPVYLVTMAGHFTGGMRQRAGGTRAQASRYLSLVINARSFWVMDTGLSRKPPAVRPAALGQVTNIAW